MNAIISPTYGWQNHPAVRMWREHAGALGFYHEAIVAEWCARGFKDTTAKKMEALRAFTNITYSSPPWLGDERVHKTHRSNLLRKDPDHYSQFGWTEPSNLLYYWPR